MQFNITGIDIDAGKTNINRNHIVMLAATQLENTQFLAEHITIIKSDFCLLLFTAFGT